MTMHLSRLSSQFWGIFFILVGLCFALLTYVILHSRRDMRKLIIGLAKIGPCTGLELAKSGYAKRGTVYVDLDVAIERGLVRDRILPLTSEELADRSGIPRREFRLTTKGWSLSNLYASDE